MTIDLITKQEYEFIISIYNKHPNLTFQNKGYQYPDKTKWSDEDKSASKMVEDILKKHIKGFHEFNHFRLSKKTKKPQLRFQYSWTADDPDSKISFSGVGYLLVDELLNGFEKETDEI